MVRAVRIFLLSITLAISSGAWSLADEATDQYAVAAGHYAAERWQLASEEFQAFLKAHAAHEQASQAQFYLAESLVQLGKLDDAKRLFEDLLNTDAKSSLARRALFRKAEATFLAGDDSSARGDLEAFTKQYPEDDLNAYVLPYLGEIALRSNQAQIAIEHYQAASTRFAKGPLVEECRFGIARAYEQLGEAEKARAEYESLAHNAYAPLADKAQLQLGVLHNSAARYADALKAFDTFAERFKDSPLQRQMQLARSWSLYKLEKHEEAEAAFKLLTDDPSTATEAWYWLGMVQMSRERWQPAIDAFAAAAKSDEKHRLQPAIGFHWGESLRQQGELDRADERFEETCRQWPQDAYADDATFGRVQIAIQKEQHQAAIEIATKFLTSYPESTLGVAADCRATIAVCNSKLGKLDEAKQALADLRTQHPKSELIAPTTYKVAEAAFQAGEQALAKELFSELTTEGNSAEWSSRGLAGLAWSQLKAEDLAGSAATFEKLLKEHPDNPQAASAAIVCGETLEKLGQSEAALAMYRRVIDDYPNSKEPYFDASYRLAVAALEARQFDHCEKLLDPLLNLADAERLRPHAYYAQSRLAMAREKWEEVAVPLEKLVANYPDHALVPTAKYWTAEAAYRRGDYRVADEQFAKLQLDGLDGDGKWTPLVSLRRAQSLVQLGKWSEALEIAKTIEREHPQFGSQYEVDYVIGRCLANDADFVGAREAYAKVVRSDVGGKTETAAMAQWMIGETHFHQEDYTAALRAYLRVEILYAYPKWQAAALMQAGKCHEQLGEWPQAAETYTKLLKTYPNSEVAEDAAKRLGVAEKRRTNQTTTQ